jgi:hypothetical protein
VDGGHVGHGDALGQGHDVSSSLMADGGAVCGGAGAGSKAGESAEGWLDGRGDLHSKAQSPFQDIMCNVVWVPCDCQ